MESFTPYSALLGGVLIGTAATLLLLLLGQIAGISGIYRGALQFGDKREPWKFWFLLGLITGGSVWWYATGGNFEPRENFPVGLTVLAGLLVGFGTRVGNGCTSGHGVCGIGRMSGRSITATISFFGVALVTTFIMRHILGVLS